MITVNSKVRCGNYAVRLTEAFYFYRVPENAVDHTTTGMYADIISNHGIRLYSCKCFNFHIVTNIDRPCYFSRRNDAWIHAFNDSMSIKWIADMAQFPDMMSWCVCRYFFGVPISIQYTQSFFKRMQPVTKTRKFTSITQSDGIGLYTHEFICDYKQPSLLPRKDNRLNIIFLITFWIFLLHYLVFLDELELSSF